jgi:hypothetical protein
LIGETEEFAVFIHFKSLENRYRQQIGLYQSHSGFRFFLPSPQPSPWGKGRSYSLSLWADLDPHPGTGHGEVKKGRRISE